MRGGGGMSEHPPPPPGVDNNNNSLKNFCGAHGLAWINTFYPHKRRGMRFHQILRRWYEHDGFMMKGDSHKMVIRISTVQEASFSDHRTKIMQI